MLVLRIESQIGHLSIVLSLLERVRQLKQQESSSREPASVLAGQSSWPRATSGDLRRSPVTSSDFLRPELVWPRRLRPCTPLDSLRCSRTTLSDPVWPFTWPLVTCTLGQVRRAALPTPLALRSSPARRRYWSLASRAPTQVHPPPSNSPGTGDYLPALGDYLPPQETRSHAERHGAMETLQPAVATGSEEPAAGQS